MIRVHRSADVQSFLDVAGPFLSDKEAQHNLILGLCSRLADDPTAFGELPYLAVAEDAGRVLGAALRTPPHNLVLSEMDDISPVEPLTRDARDVFLHLPGVLGPRDQALVCARLWCQLSGARAELVEENRIYRASTATPPAGVGGTIRPYDPSDRDLTIRWLDAFTQEAHSNQTVHESSETMLERRLADPAGGLRMWEAGGRPVSIAGFGGRTPNGIRIGPVYTPPEHRTHGYASALVGRMTAELLTTGYRHCFLFTDLANPTSNSIYQRVGYRPVSDVNLYAFA